ncbi:MAG: hypothetical protein RBR68_07205 [Tenuifilaceae bacterium]|nr:hypothetical protein [Tenuifilaceae bacterium]
MAIEKINLETLFGRIASFEAEAKEQRGLIKEALETFANQNQIKVKSLKKSYKEWKELQKDKAEFTVVDAEVTTLVGLLTEDDEEVNE